MSYPPRRLPPPPPEPRPRPNPSRTENGCVACNEPLTVSSEVVGYCGVLVKPRWSGFLRRTPPGTHPGRRHRIEWGTR